MDKKIEEVVSEQLNAEMWSWGLYMAFQVYFKGQNMPIFSSWLDMQVQKKDERIRKMVRYLLEEGCEVSMAGRVCRLEKWPSPMVAMEALFDHEEYFYRQVKEFLDWVRHVDDSNLCGLAFDLYGDEIQVSDVFAELLRILVKEWRRMLPLDY